ncbi:hypothetical protein BD779DRAFT_1467185 [Infundibulicybe gibba]|nr:hypothetical protein BD779DRAFT_1467185 [Infundibulicybe gibba]
MSSTSVEERWKARSRDALSQLARRPPANAYSGRSVKVTNGNVAEAYKQLENILSRNKVKAQLRLAARHEKKGVKRRRLSSERWRKNFAHEVRQKVQLVSKIRDRGA